MINLTLLEWSSIAQITTAIITAVGVFTSIYISVKALREVQEDRRQRQRPHLLFESGARIYSIEFTKIGKAIPGIDPKSIKDSLSYIPHDAESILIKQNFDKNESIAKDDFIFIGSLKNYGMGPALETTVTWVPGKITIGSETFIIDHNKLKEPVYCREGNNLPAVPGHIAQNEKSGLTRLPTFIVKDFEKKITEIEGVLEINYKDVFGVTHITKQGFRLFTEYKKLQITIVFLDLISTDSH